MKYKPIANTGVYVSELCLGAMTFGSQWEVIGALGQTEAGRYLQVVYVPDAEPNSVFVITAYELKGKALAAYRRRRKRK